jgi:hypothetical protein
VRVARGKPPRHCGLCPVPAYFTPQISRYPALVWQSTKDFQHNCLQNSGVCITRTIIRFACSKSVRDFDLSSPVNIARYVLCFYALLNLLCTQLDALETNQV